MSDEPFRIMRAGSDAEARRNAGAYGASVYDVQNTGPSVMDTLGLMGFLAGGPVGPATAKFAGQLGGAAQRGTDWARARLFEHFAPGFNHSAAGMAGEIGARSMVPEWRLPGQNPINAYAPQGATVKFSDIMNKGGTPNEFALPIGQSEVGYLNSLLAQQNRNGFNIVPGGKP